MSTPIVVAVETAEEAFDQVSCLAGHEAMGELLFLPPVFKEAYVEVIHSYIWEYLIGCVWVTL